MKSPIAIFTLLLSLSWLASAATVEKQGEYFVQANSITEVGIARPFPYTDGDTANKAYSGSFFGTIGIDCGTLEPKTYNFDGGTIITTSFNLAFDALIIYPTIGTKFTYVNRQSTTVNYSPFTDSTFGDGVVRPDGSLITPQHRLLASNGVVATVRSVANYGQQPRIITDYLNFPDDEVPFFGDTKLSVEEVSKTLYQRRIRVILTVDVATNDLLLLPGTVPSLNTYIADTEEGTINIRSNQITIPSCFGKWASENRLINPNPETLNPADIPYAILMALNLPVTTSVLPISIEKTASGPLATIDLPIGGLENPMSVEYTTDLSDYVCVILISLH